MDLKKIMRGKIVKAKRLKSKENQGKEIYAIFLGGHFKKIYHKLVMIMEVENVLLK